MFRGASPWALMILVVGCSAPGSDLNRRCVPEISIQFCRDGFWCEVHVINRNPFPVQWWDSFADRWRVPRDDAAYWVEVYAQLTNGEEVTQNEDTPGGWWTLAKFSSNLLVSVPMASIPAHSTERRTVNLLPMVISAYEYRHHESAPPDLAARIARLGIRCKIALSPGLDDSLELQHVWDIRALVDPGYYPYPRWRTSTQPSTATRPSSGRTEGNGRDEEKKGQN